MTPARKGRALSLRFPQPMRNKVKTKMIRMTRMARSTRNTSRMMSKSKTAKQRRLSLRSPAFPGKLRKETSAATLKIS